MTPRDIPAVHRILEAEYRRHKAPIIELIEAETHDPFRVLVGTILSARTKDETTAAVCRRLFRTVRKPGDLRRYTPEQLEKIIYPIGFYRTKARHLRALPDALDDLFDGVIPDTIDDLCKLPGVGRKTANLVRSVAFDKPAICVDVHVHRISNRLGLVNTRSPHETEKALRKCLPVRYWKSWNRYLVSFGQTICRPLSPRCSACPLTPYCSQIGLAAASRKPKPTPSASRSSRGNKGTGGRSRS